ncbi:MAG TPA: protoporphyrinogen oxidase [Acidimicrobiales bacterium]|nr:protoporphyrinogen oxidase [Acidimicrobiales bacterium]
MRAAVVGGGIAGLSAAWELTSGGADVTVYEPGQLGGKLRTSAFLGRPVDEGPDALLARVPEGVTLCEELGLADDLVAPAASKALLYTRGRLRALPDGLVLGAPARLLPLARSGILSPLGMLRAAGDIVLPSTHVSDDESVFDIVARRFGREVADRLIEPLVGSIYAGTTRGLSAATTAPQLLRAASRGRSLLLSLRASSPGSAGGPSPSAGPTFLAPRGGLQAIVDTLVQQLRERGARFEPLEVLAISAGDKGRGPVSVSTASGASAHDAAVLAVPAPAAAGLLSGTVAASAYLRSVQLSSVAIVTLGVAAGALPVPEGTSGVLVAPGTGMFTTAVSFGSRKWPHWCAPGTEVVRVSVGKIGDDRWLALDDGELVARIRAELGTILSCPAPTLVDGGSRVSRWPSSLPQYPVGHLGKISSLKAEIARVAPVLAVAGASFGRVGVPANIAAGREAARSLLGPGPSDR